MVLDTIQIGKDTPIQKIKDLQKYGGRLVTYNPQTQEEVSFNVLPTPTWKRIISAAWRYISRTPYIYLNIKN